MSDYINVVTNGTFIMNYVFSSKMVCFSWFFKIARRHLVHIYRKWEQQRLNDTLKDISIITPCNLKPLWKTSEPKTLNKWAYELHPWRLTLNSPHAKSSIIDIQNESILINSNDLVLNGFPQPIISLIKCHIAVLLIHLEHCEVDTSR